MEDVWFAVVLASCLVALGNWRAGIYAGLLLDCVRDPVRKLADDHSVLITIGGAAVWGAVLLRMLIDHQAELRVLLQRYPALRPMIVFLLMAVIPVLPSDLAVRSSKYRCTPEVPEPVSSVPCRMVSTARRSASSCSPR